MRNLVFVKSDLGIEEPESISHVNQVLWLTLDLLNGSPSQDLSEATENRYNQLKGGLKRLFAEKILCKDQVQKTLDYCKRTIFGHMQLYMACMGQKKQQSRLKRIEIFTETPQCCLVGDLQTECREVLDEHGRAATPDDFIAGGSAIGGDDHDAEQKEEGVEEEEDEVIDPNDPLYGLDTRLSQLNLDPESQVMLRAKLAQASAKIREGLERRQQDLDLKLTTMQQGVKKR